MMRYYCFCPDKTEVERRRGELLKGILHRPMASSEMIEAVDVSDVHVDAL